MKRSHFLFLLPLLVSGMAFGGPRKSRPFGNEIAVSIHALSARQVESPYNRSEPIERIIVSDFDGTLTLPSALPLNPFHATLRYQGDDELFVSQRILVPDPRALSTYLDFHRLENTPWILETDCGSYVRVLPSRFKISLLPNGNVKYYVTVKLLELPAKDRRGITLLHSKLDIPLSQFANRVHREPEAFFGVNPDLIYRVNHESEHLFQVVVLGFEPISTAGAPHDLSDYMRGNENENGYLAHAVLKEHFEDSAMTQVPIYRLPIGLLGKGPIQGVMVHPPLPDLMRGLAAFRTYNLDVGSESEKSRWEKLVRAAHALHPTRLIPEVLLRRDCAALLAQGSSRSAIDTDDKTP